MLGPAFSSMGDLFECADRMLIFFWRLTMEELYGIGPANAIKLRKALEAANRIEPGKTYSEDDIRGILQKAHNDGVIKLSAITLADLKYKPARVIPREVIALLESELRKVWKGIKFEVAGSYRRGKTTSGDVDIVAIGDWADLSQRIKKSRLVRVSPPFEQGPQIVGAMFAVACPKKYRTDKKYIVIKGDIFFTNEKEFMFALLFATGSGMFNVRMRALAKRRGYLLNQHGLFRNGRRVPVKDEKALFRLLGMRYRKPNERE